MATIEGFIVNYTHIQDMQTKSYGENLSLQVADPYKTSVQIPGLRSYAWYEICILAYARDVRSQCSTSIKVSTKESGKILNCAGSGRRVSLNQIFIICYLWCMD